MTYHTKDVYMDAFDALENDIAIFCCANVTRAQPCARKGGLDIQPSDQLSMDLVHSHTPKQRHDICNVTTTLHERTLSQKGIFEIKSNLAWPSAKPGLSVEWSRDKTRWINKTTW